MKEYLLVVTQDGWMGPFDSCKICGLTILEMGRVSMEDGRANYLSGGHINDALKGAGSLNNSESNAKTVLEFNVLRTGNPQMLQLECFPEGPGSVCNMQWECIRCNTKKASEAVSLRFKEAAYATLNA